MENEKLKQYYLSSADAQKGLELAQQDKQFKQEIDGLKSNQEKLDSKHGELGKELRTKSQEEIEKNPNAFQKLRDDYDKTGKEAEENSTALKAKEKEYEEFKEQNKGSLGKDATQKDVNNTFDTAKYGEQGAASGLTANRYHSNTAENLPQGKNEGNAIDRAQERPTITPAEAKEKDKGKDITD